MFRLDQPHTARIGWLRAAVLGANDGIVSIASLIVGVAAAQVSRHDVLLAGVAGLAAGALSMAAGEYVSVSSQADTERAALDHEARELAARPEEEEAELRAIYEERGLGPDLAYRVARQLMASDPLGSHARDELGLSPVLAARPFQAAWTSGAAFSAGAALPIVTVVFAPTISIFATVSAVSLGALALLGTIAAWAGGAPLARGAARVTFWGALAMIATAGVGRLFDIR